MRSIIIKYTYSDGELPDHHRGYSLGDNAYVFTQGNETFLFSLNRAPVDGVLTIQPQTERIAFVELPGLPADVTGMSAGELLRAWATKK